MSQFNSVEDAKLSLKSALDEIKEILQRDLQNISPEQRTVDLWFQVHGKNRSLDLTKEVLRELEMKAIDSEIFILDQSVKKKNMADTLC